MSAGQEAAGEGPPDTIEPMTDRPDRSDRSPGEQPIDPLEPFRWHPEPELIGIRDAATSRAALERAGATTWAASLDWLYDEAMVRAVSAYAATLGVDVVGEGVETEAQLAKLREIGIRMAQGYFFAPPLPAETIESRYLTPILKTA